MQLPTHLLQALTGINGYVEQDFITTHTNGTIINSIRINDAKVSKDDLPLPFSEAIPWATNGYYLSNRPKYTLDPLLHAGCYYVQEASSMFVAQAILQNAPTNEPLKVLDLCAAPGGKTTHLLSLLNTESIVVANEVIANRNATLQENCTKWGYPNIIITQNDAKDFAALEGFFDIIVIDAPCSGSGLFRRDEAAIAHWSQANVQLCAERQQRIIADVLPALKKGGLLIYSTCSYSIPENEGIMDWLSQTMQMDNKTITLQEDWNITITTSKLGNIGYRFWPHLVKGEGFFLGCFSKTIGDDKTKKAKLKSIENIPKDELLLANRYFNDSSNFQFTKHNDTILALPTTLANHLSQLQQSLYIRQAGIALGTAIKGTIIPTHNYAMAIHKNTLLPTIAVDEATALQYLRKQDITLTNADKGLHLISYKNAVLGLVKNLGNRVNNYYPKNWRILKS